MPDDKPLTGQTFGRFDSNRRNVLKKGGLMAATFAIGVPATSGTAAAEEIKTMEVDVPPIIPSDQQGLVVTAIYPGGDMDPVELLNHELVGFKLGPNAEDIDFDPGDVEGHADAVRWRLLPTGNMGVFFDSSTAETWFTPGDDEAKLSAIGREGDGNEIMIAWGSDEVTVRATPSPN